MIVSANGETVGDELLYMFIGSAALNTLMYILGINVGAFYTVSTLLNQTVLQYYPVEHIHLNIVNILGRTHERWPYWRLDCSRWHGWLSCLWCLARLHTFL